MPRIPTALAALVALVLTVAACSPGGGAASPAIASSPAATWRTTPLTDVRTGETFTIDGFAGKLVAIEPMAIWCSNCRIQQQEAATALAAVASDDLVYIALDVDSNEQPADLAAYSAEEGFDWPYAVASVDVARSLAAEFGDQVLSPPSTPLILLGPGGELIEQHIGIRRAAELEALFRQHLP
jgi:thiol-disulfide isomerase/thioredoxin